MIVFVQRKMVKNILFLSSLLCAMLFKYGYSGVGESAVITLVFPPGARATGTGEAFTGLSDDATATYYNPAGLGLSPMANSWKTYFTNNEYIFTKIVAQKKKDLTSRSVVWAGTNKGLLRFNGKLWEKIDFYLIEQGDNLESVASKFIEIEDNNPQQIQRVSWILRTENGIGMKHYAAIKMKLDHELKLHGKKTAVDSSTPPSTPAASDSIAPSLAPIITDSMASQSGTETSAASDSMVQSITPLLADSTAVQPNTSITEDSLAQSIIPTKVDSSKQPTASTIPTDLPTTASINTSADSTSILIARQLVELPQSDRIATKIYAIISSVIDSTRASSLSDEIETIFSEEDKKFDDLTELKIPFSIAISDSVTALAIDKSDRLWAGTEKGLWRLYENKWSFYSMIDGLPSNKITALSAGPYGELAVGTDNGVALYTNGEWVKKTDSSSHLASNLITALAFGQNGIIYAGTDSGLVKIDQNKITLYDTTNGLLTRQVHSLFMDSGNKLWIGGLNGITIFNNVSWKRYQFPNSIITSFTEQNEHTVWIGTDKGAISYIAGKSVTDERGNVTEALPEWKPFHSKNALIGDKVYDITVQDKDIWLITEKGINQYDVADRQTSIAFEMLLPAFKINDLWHLYWTLIWPTENWGTIGGFINYINMGQNTFTDALGREGRKVRSWEGVFGLSYGMTVTENLSLGLNVKYVVSALAPGYDNNGAGVGYTFAIDASVLKRKLFNDKFDIGFMFQNMGPDIFYIDEKNKDPIPFTLRLGTVYHVIENPVHDLKILFDMHKEVVKNNFEAGDPDPFYKALWTDLLHDTTSKEDLKYQLQEINYNIGMEYWYTSFLALRSGFLFDYLGERYELTAGVGIRYGTLNVDWSYIYAPEGFLKGILSKMSKGKDGATGARDGQWRASFIFVF